MSLKKKKKKKERGELRIAGEINTEYTRAPPKISNFSHELSRRIDDSSPPCRNVEVLTQTNSRFLNFGQQTFHYTRKQTITMAPGRTARAGARGGRGTARGTTRGTTARGRGRGRGRSATATSNDAPASDIAENASAESQPKSTGTSSDTIIPDDMGNSSSSQAQREPPAAATTPTESSTPATASKPAPAKPATAGSARGAAKFLPRATRRSQLDREALAQKELQKQETRAAIDARLKRMGRGRGGARRSRGGAPGGYQDRIIKASAGGLGPFSEVPQSRESYRSCCVICL